MTQIKLLEKGKKPGLNLLMILMNKEEVKHQKRLKNYYKNLNNQKNQKIFFLMKNLKTIRKMIVKIGTQMVKVNKIKKEKTRISKVKIQIIKNLKGEKNSILLSLKINQIKSKRN